MSSTSMCYSEYVRYEAPEKILMLCFQWYDHCYLLKVACLRRSNYKEERCQKEASYPIKSLVISCQQGWLMLDQELTVYIIL